MCPFHHAARMFSQYMPTTWPCLKKSVSSSFLQFSILRARRCCKWSSDKGAAGVHVRMAVVISGTWTSRKRFDFFKWITVSMLMYWQTMPHVLYLWSICKARLMFWTWHDTSLARNTCNGRAHQKSYVLQTLHTLHHTYILCPPLLRVLPTSFWHFFWHSFWHPFSDTPHWTHRIAVEVRHATLNSHNRGWGPARHTELTGLRLRSGTPHWTHRIAVEVRHATLNSQDRGWGPARSALNSQDRRWGPARSALNSRDRGWGPARHTALTWSHEKDEDAEEKEKDEEDAEDKWLT